MGGTNINDDISRLKNNKFQILVGSPGRILHLIKMNAISAKSVRLFVLDEADRLMEESFQKDINYIYSQLPERKQLIAASATYTPELKEFLQRYMQTPSHIMPYSSSVLLGVAQKISIVPTHGSTVRQNKIKSDKLLEILTQVPFKQCLVFCRYQVRAQTICDLLAQEGWPVKYLASSQKQAERLDSLKKLQNYSCRILVATDLAARGIDATNVDLVINLDAPDNIATYLHRIGRCGRYGSKGMAITIVATGQEELNFTNMLSSLGECNLMKFEQNECEDFVPDRSSFPSEKNSDLKEQNSVIPKECDVKSENNSVEVIQISTSIEQNSNSMRHKSMKSEQKIIIPDKNFLDSKENSTSKHSLKKIPISIEKTENKNTEKLELPQVDITTLMTFTPNENVYEPFSNIEKSFDEFLETRKKCDISEKDCDKFNFKYEDYISEKNTSILHFLNLHLNVSDNFNDKMFNGNRKPLNLKGYPKKLSYNNNDDAAQSSIIETDNKENTICDDKLEKQNKKKSQNKFASQNKKPIKTHECETVYESDEDYTEYSSSDYTDVDSEDGGLNEYLLFKKQLENMSNQIQHSVYISTLLGNHKLN